MKPTVNLHALLPILLLVLSAVHVASGFSLQNDGLLRGRRPTSTSNRPACTVVNVRMSNGEEGEGRSSKFASSIDELVDRRSAIMTGLSGVAAALSTGTAVVQPALAADGKIVIFGGSGYVGSHVAQLLTSKGYSVVSVSRSSPSDQADKIAKILGKPLSGGGIEYVSLDASTDDLGNVLKGATAVVSCVGVAPGGANQRAGNGAVNVRIANAAKAAGNKRFVYISVASELANGPAKFLLGDYLKGKAEAETAVINDFGTENSLVVKPAIIAGGPPGEIRPPGPPGVKPAAVEDVAKAVVAGALGQRSGTIDGNGAIATL